MSPEQKHAKDVLWCLNELKAELLFAKHTHHPHDVVFTLREPTDGVPTYSDQGKILYFLESVNALSVVGTSKEFEEGNSRNPDAVPLEYFIKILPGFDSVYSNYEDANTSNANPRSSVAGDISVRLLKHGDILFLEGNGERYRLKGLRPNGYPNQIFDFLLRYKPNELATIHDLNEYGIKFSNELNEIVYNAGLKGTVAHYFLGKSSNKDVLLRDSAVMPMSDWEIILMEVTVAN